MSGIGHALKRMRPKALLGVAAVCFGVGGGALAAFDVRALRPFTRALALLLAVGVVGLVLAIVRLARARLDQVDPARRNAVTRWTVGLTAVLLTLAAMATYSLGFHWKVTRRLCGDAEQGATIEQRRLSLSEGQARLRSPFAVLPELVGFRVSETCEAAAWDLSRIDRGECPTHLIKEHACRCGREQYPR